MNCKQVQELLPLYVGRDLEERRAQQVAAHVQTCSECAGSVDEYRETRQLLQQFAPPPFSEAVYAGIRQRVLRDIEREATAPGLSRLLESLFRPRLRWAAATALLLAVSVFAFYFIAKRANDRRDGQQLADSGRTVGGPTSSSIKASEWSPPASPVKNKGPAQGLAGGTHQSQRRKGIAGVPDRSATVNSIDPRSMTAEASPEGNNLAEPDAVPARDPAASEKTLRVEMQTKDPNIRIIWFAHQPTKQDSPSKFSKGT
jgi:Putative zinc-finger